MNRAQVGWTYRAALKSYLDALSKVTQQEFSGWNKAQQMAFLINAYNAYTVEKILTQPLRRRQAQGIDDLQLNDARK